VRAVEKQVVELLARSRALLVEMDFALNRVVEHAGSRRDAAACLVNYVHKMDAEWLCVLIRASETRGCTIYKRQFSRGIDYVCDALNGDGRTLPLVDRVRGMMIAAHVHGMNAEWAASLIAVASESDWTEALASVGITGG
jgi:hypothetical protein